MASQDFLREHPELTPFVLSNVQLTGTTIGRGSYGSVEEAAILGAICAAKMMHDFFQDPRQVPVAVIRKTSAQFVKECKMMSTLRHPNIVQFIGIAFFRSTRMPALVMERLLTNLHFMLDPGADRRPPLGTPKPYIPLSLKCSILHNVACGLAFLQERSPPIIHRDLSARNILINSGMVAKIADLGVARIVPSDCLGSAATMTKGPGASVYMPPEALESKPSDNEDDRDRKSRYDASIDIFSFGVVAIFTLCQTFPCNLLAPTYPGEEHGTVLGRSEIQRREEYMRMINEKLQENHPLLRMIRACLHFPKDRPNVHDVLRLLEEARDEVDDEQTDLNKLELIQIVQNKSRRLQDFEASVLELETRRDYLEQELQTFVQELDEALQKLEEKEKQLESARQSWKLELARLLQELEQKEEQLMYKEMELTRAREAVRTHQQKIEEIEKQQGELVDARDRHIAETQQKLREKESELAEAMERSQRQKPKYSAVAACPTSKKMPLDVKIEAMVSKSSFLCEVSGPGLTSATINHPKHILVQLLDSSSRLYSEKRCITAQLELVSPPSRKTVRSQTIVSTIDATSFKVSYTAVNRGQHKLHVQLNDKEINGSPFSITIYPQPSQLRYPVRTLTGLSGPYGIAYNSNNHIIVTERVGHRLSIFNGSGVKVRTIGEDGHGPSEMQYPKGVATDDCDNIFVCSQHKLQKFTGCGRLIKCIGQKGSQEGEFDDPRGVTFFKKQVYVCDSKNHHIQVFNLDLSFVRSIKSSEISTPLEIKFDDVEQMYVIMSDSGQVKVLDSRGKLQSIFGGEEEGKLFRPSSPDIANNYVYVSDLTKHCVFVFQILGKFVASFGGKGIENGDFQSPYCITSTKDGFVHVCDSWNNRIQTF